MLLQKTTAIAALFILLSGASVAYFVTSQQEISTLKQRIAELPQELTQANTQQRRPQAKQLTGPSRTVTDTPVKEAVTASAADASLSDEGAVDPLTQAVLAGDVDALRSLIESGADLTGVYADGQSLLHLVAQSGDAEVVALLIEAGLDAAAVDEKGRP